MKTNYRLYIYIFKIHVLDIKEIPPQQIALITETRLLDVMTYAIATRKTALFHKVNTHVNNSLKKVLIRSKNNEDYLTLTLNIGGFLFLII